MNLEVMVVFGILVEWVFEFDDWVGGCYFMWGLIGFLIMLVIGLNDFNDFLCGV